MVIARAVSSKISRRSPARTGASTSTRGTSPIARTCSTEPWRLGAPARATRSARPVSAASTSARPGARPATRAPRRPAARTDSTARSAPATDCVAIAKVGAACAGLHRLREQQLRHSGRPDIGNLRHAVHVRRRLARSARPCGAPPRRPRQTADFAVNTPPSQSRDEGDTWSHGGSTEALKQSPLARVKDEFGGKDKLVDKIVGILDAGDESKDELRKRLLGVANTQADPAALGRHADRSRRAATTSWRRPPPRS